MNVRRPTAADAAAVTELIQAFDLATTGEAEIAEADVLRDWARIDLDREAWLLELDGALAGYCELTDRADELLASGYVHPDFFGLGVGTRLAELTEQEALARGARALRNAVLSEDTRARTLLAGRGYRPVRHFYRMVIELTEPPPAPEWPAGVTVSSFDYPAEARAFHAALEETFAAEWDHRPETFEEWHERRIVRMPFDPSLWFVVRAGGEIAAVAACDWKRFDMGFVAAIGVRKPWRRRGLGLALLRHAFGEFYRRGERRVGLGVDASNPTGATRLYERAGMRVAFRATYFEKLLAG